jgi:hypothetical protein
MNTHAPTISAIIILWNGRRFVEELMLTLEENLRELPHEIIIVDNGSRDGSAEYIETRHPQCRIIRNGSNLGFAKAVNIGLEAATGAYLYILNQDLRFKPGATQALLERIRLDSTIGLIGPKFIYFDGPTQRSIRSFPTYKHVLYRLFFLDRLFRRSPEFASWRMGHFDHESEAFVDQPMGAVMLVPRTVIEKVDLMDERFPILFNDVDWCRRIHEAGYRLLYYPGAVVEHYVGASTSTMPTRIRIISHTSLYRYLKKYARPKEYPLLWLCGLVLMASLPPAIAINWLRRKLTALKASS